MANYEIKITARHRKSKKYVDSLVVQTFGKMNSDKDFAKTVLARHMGITKAELSRQYSISFGNWVNLHAKRAAARAAEIAAGAGDQLGL